MTNELWLRFQPRESSELMPENDALSVLTPFHLRHAVTFGRPNQAALIGKGEADSKIIVNYAVGPLWSYRDAVAYCTQAFGDFAKRMNDGSVSIDRAVTLEMVENLPGALLGRQIISPIGMVSQEIILPESTYQQMLSEAGSETVAFLIAREVARICLENRHFDLQPHEFRKWAVPVLVNCVSPPGKKPERWGKFPRNHLVLNLLKQLQGKGLNLTRNETSEQTSAFDAVAHGARNAGVSGLSSYETVKQIFYRVMRSATAM